MRIATDIGGTFTDLVYLDEASGTLREAKSSSTPADFALGVLDSLEKAGVDVASAAFFVHGATVVINALTERKGAKTALITTKGFRDVLEIGRANRPDLYNLFYAKPRPFVPRYLRLEVRERMNYKGEELTPLDPEGVRAAAELCRREGVEAIAVCFLHSYANPAHEIECGELLEELLPEIPVTLSHRVTKEWREYARTNTAVLNAYVHPIAKRYLNHLEKSLTVRGMGPVGHIMQSNGGTATFATARDLPVYTVESGPVAGVIGAAEIGKLIGEPNVISLDIGGTTAKTSLIENGTPKITTEYKIEYRRDYAGYPILAPTVDIVEIGAGGGSIAWIDGAGALKVGPVSAGADPGPACYDKGGDRPTVTDANVIAGRINPAYFLGGEIPLNVARARQAVKQIADHFGTSVEEAAIGVIRLADANMVNALKLVSVRRGYDPRDFVLIAFGGGGGMHAASLARELRVRKVVIPTNPAVFSAWGMLMTDLRRDYIRTRILRADRVEPQTLIGIYGQMEGEAVRDLASEHVARGDIRLVRYADMRYAGQEHTVKVPVPGGVIDRQMLEEIKEGFHALHKQAYTFRLDSPVEFVNFHLTALGAVTKPEIPKVQGGDSLEDARKGERSVDFGELGLRAAAIYERDRLPLGEPVTGPAVVEEPSSVTVVFPGQALSMDEYGFLHISQEG
ncbi:MAG: hydantoinase/oxoprolinase family protein [Bacillota bacterium]